MTESETVYMNRGKRARTYHTDRDCQYLDGDVREVAREQIAVHYDECQVCAAE